MTEAQTAARSINIRDALAARAHFLELLKLGNGPWRILPECPAPSGHNTTNAARGVGAAGLRCICPRGRLLLAAYQRSEKERRIEQGRGARKETDSLNRSIPSIPKMLSFDLPVRGPDYTSAVCRRTPDAVAVADRAFGNENGLAPGAIRAAKRQCGRCPAQLACAANVLQREILNGQAGEWGGVWGGMSPADRTRLARMPEVRAARLERMARS